jgi:hypothetical protein
MVCVYVTGNEVGLVVVGNLHHLEGSSGGARLEQTGLAGMWSPIKREIGREREREREKEREGNRERERGRRKKIEGGGGRERRVITEIKESDEADGSSRSGADSGSQTEGRRLMYFQSNKVRCVLPCHAGCPDTIALHHITSILTQLDKTVEL